MLFQRKENKPPELCGKVFQWLSKWVQMLKCLENSNAEAQTPEESFKRNAVIPIIDHIADEQFSPSVAVSTSLLGLVPCVLCARDVDLKAALSKS